MRRARTTSSAHASYGAPPEVGTQAGVERRVGEHPDVVDAVGRASSAPPFEESADCLPVRPARRGAAGEHEAPGLRVFQLHLATKRQFDLVAAQYVKHDDFVA